MSFTQHTSSETTGEILATQEKVARIRRLNALRKEIAQAQPPRRYTRITLAAAGVAIVDWVAVAAHVSLAHRKHLGSVLGAHLALVVSLTVAAVVLGAVWAVMNEQCKQEARRDEIENLRQEERTTLINQLLLHGFDHEARGYVTGLRDAGVHGGPPAPPPPGVTQLRPHRRGSGRGRQTS